jgi:hypothetical protein
VKPPEVNVKRKRRELFVLIASLKRLLTSAMLVRSEMIGLILIQGKTGANLLS